MGENKENSYSNTCTRTHKHMELSTMPYLIYKYCNIRLTSHPLNDIFLLLTSKRNKSVFINVVLEKFLFDIKLRKFDFK